MENAKTFQRKTIIINKNLQYKYMFLITFSVFIAFMIMAIDMLWTLSKVVSEHPMMEPLLEEFYSMTPLFFIKIIMYLIIVIIVSAVISHKMAGPIYKFEKSCKTISDGDLNHRVYLRKGDQLVQLQDLFNEMVSKFSSYVKLTEDLKKKFIEKDEVNKKEVEEFDKKVKEIMPNFKI